MRDFHHIRRFHLDLHDGVVRSLPGPDFPGDRDVFGTNRAGDDHRLRDPGNHHVFEEPKTTSERVMEKALTISFIDRVWGVIREDLIWQFFSKTGFLTLSNYFCQLNVTINLNSN